jgi:hypothetical protein
MKAAARWAIIMVGALVLPLMISGITEASTTRSPETPSPADAHQPRPWDRYQVPSCRFPSGDRRY